MSDLESYITLARLLQAQLQKRTGKTLPVDPVEIAKCVRDLGTKLVMAKKEHLKILFNQGSLDEKLLRENIQRMTKMTVKIERKRTILIVPVGKEEYRYEVGWM